MCSICESLNFPDQLRAAFRKISVPGLPSELPPVKKESRFSGAACKLCEVVPLPSLIRNGERLRVAGSLVLLPGFPLCRLSRCRRRPGSDPGTHCSSMHNSGEQLRHSGAVSRDPLTVGLHPVTARICAGSSGTHNLSERKMAMTRVVRSRCACRGTPPHFRSRAPCPGNGGGVNFSSLCVEKS